MGISALVVILLIIIVVASSVYLNGTFNTVSSKTDNSSTFTSQSSFQQSSSSSSQEVKSPTGGNPLLFSFTLNSNFVIQGQSTLSLLENLTNVSNQTQSFEGARGEAPTYFLFYSSNDSLVCAYYNSAFDEENFSIQPSQSLSFHAVLPTYSYSSGNATSCGGIADASAGTYILQVFSVWGSGKGSDITPFASGNTTISVIAQSIQTVNATTTSQINGETCTPMDHGNQTSATETYLCHTLSTANSGSSTG